MKKTIELVNKSNNDLPKYAHVGDSGMDVKAFIEEPITLKPLERRRILTGLFVNFIPEGYEIQVRPRSGLALKRGLTVLNSPGTVDACFRGEIGVIIVNLSAEEQTIDPGERIAQLVVAPVEICKIKEVNEVNLNTERGDSGYGDSGRY